MWVERLREMARWLWLSEFFFLLAGARGDEEEYMKVT